MAATAALRATLATAAVIPETAATQTPTAPFQPAVLATSQRGRDVRGGCGAPSDRGCLPRGPDWVRGAASGPWVTQRDEEETDGPTQKQREPNRPGSRQGPKLLGPLLKFRPLCGERREGSGTYQNLRKTACRFAPEDKCRRCRSAGRAQGGKWQGSNTKMLQGNRRKGP